MSGSSRRELFLSWVAASLGMLISPTRERALPSANESDLIKLPDGRRLAFSEYGNRSGDTIVIHHHSLPSSRREAEVFLPALENLPRVRLLSFDRPGFGGSGAVPVKSYFHWVEDLKAALESLEISHFRMTAFSGGTPFALAVASALPEKVIRLSFGCAVGEHRIGRFNGTAAPNHRLCRFAPTLGSRLVERFREAIERSPNQVLLPFRPLPKKEYELFADPNVVQFAADRALDGLSQGPAGCVQEAALLGAPYGIALDEIKAPATFWHGGSDKFSPPWKSRELAGRLKNAVFHISPGDGHLSLPKNRAEEILAAAIG